MRKDVTSAACSSWSTERCALAAEALRRSGHLRLRVHGESMLPALWPGDLVEIASCPLEDVRPGEIVLVRRDGRFFLHRLVAGNASGFLLRGDSVPGSDPPYPPEAMLGRLVGAATGAWAASTAALRPGAGAKWSRALGMLLCHCGIARRIALNVHSRRQPSLPLREFRKREFRNHEARGDVSPAALGA